MESEAAVLDAREVAELVGVSVEHVRRLAREGRIPAHSAPGNRTSLFLRDEVERWWRGGGAAALVSG